MAQLPDGEDEKTLTEETTEDEQDEFIPLDDVGFAPLQIYLVTPDELVLVRNHGFLDKYNCRITPIASRHPMTVLCSDLGMIQNPFDQDNCDTEPELGQYVNIFNRHTYTGGQITYIPGYLARTIEVTFVFLDFMLILCTL